MKAPALRLAGDSEKRLPKKVLLSAKSIEAMRVPAGRDRAWLYDTRTPGLCVLATATGSKSFYLYRKVGGRPQRLRLGGYPDITVETARELAAEATGDIAKGKDPMAEKRAIRAESTFGEVFAWYMKNHATPRKRTAAKDQERYDKHLAKWATRKLASITRGDVAALHAKVGGTTGNRVLALVSVIFNKARIIGFKGENPAAGIQRFREKSRERFLSATELPKFLKALADEPNETWRDFFSLCLWTGARSGNVKSMRWEELDLAAGTWRIPAEKAKGGEGMSVHLSAPALAILKGRKGNQSEWVFPGPGKLGHVAEPKTAWAELCARAGVAGLWIHDLRRTMASWQAAGGASLHVIGKSLGHANAATTQVYARLTMDPVKASVDGATRAMLDTAAKAKADQTAEDEEFIPGT